MANEKEMNYDSQLLNLDELEKISGGSEDGGTTGAGLPAIYCNGDPNGPKHQWVEEVNLSTENFKFYRCANCTMRAMRVVDFPKNVPLPGQNQ